jgi:actinorhodin biosynthesis protein ActVIA
MTQHITTSNSTLAPEIYSRIDQFYAVQMQALDEGDISGWVGTFAEDGVFVSNGLSAPVAGRAQLTTLARETTARLDEKRAIRRHFVFNLIVRQLAGGILHATAYVPVFDTIGGVTSLTTSTVMRDELVSSDDGLLVRHRTVTRDDLAVKP